MKKSEMQTFCMNCPRFVAWLWPEGHCTDGTWWYTVYFRCYRRIPSIDDKGFGKMDLYRECGFGHDMYFDEKEHSLMRPCHDGKSCLIQLTSLKDENLLKKIRDCAGKADRLSYAVGDKRCYYCMERMLDGWNEDKEK